MLEKAVRICDAKFGFIPRWDGNAFDPVATYNVPPAYANSLRGVRIHPKPGMPLERMLATKTTVHVADLAAEPIYTEERHPLAVAAVELGGIRTVLAVPMLKVVPTLKNDEMVGAIYIYRQEVRPFTDKQIALVTNFAAQAVIAVESTRLLSELRESLQEQTATAEVLQVINSSSGDLEPVFAAMLEKAARICDAAFGNIYRWDGNALHLVGTHNTPPALAEARGQSPMRPTGISAVATKTTVHVADLAAEQVYTEERDPTIVAGVELGGIRTLLLVPMLKENDDLRGTYVLERQKMNPLGNTPRLFPTALTNFLGCHHLSVLERMAARNLARRPFFDDPMLDILRERGIDHERAYVQHLVQNGKRVIEISRSSSKLF